jgi:hypothetical protein
VQNIKSGPQGREMARKTLLEGISIREFARLDGCDEALVRRAVRKGYLPKLNDGSLDPNLAGTGWRFNNRKGADSARKSADTFGLVRNDETPEQIASRIVNEEGRAPYSLGGGTDQGKLSRAFAPA